MVDLVKPVTAEELQARLIAAGRVLRLQLDLARRVAELEQALAHVRQLQGILPICMYCKKIRDDQNYWQQVEAYICRHSAAQFSHGICPECFEKVMQEYYQDRPPVLTVPGG